MYQTAGQLFKLNRNKFQKKKPIQTIQHHHNAVKTPIPNKTPIVVESFTPKNTVLKPENYTPVPKETQKLLETVDSNNVIQEKNNNEEIYYLRDPTVWGPIFWFSLHNGAAKYPENPSKHTQEKIKGFIMGIPYMLPCEECSEHAKDFIEKNKNNLDNIVKDRDSYFKFTYDLHDNTNDIVGNKKISLDEAKKIYYDDL